VSRVAVEVSEHVAEVVLRRPDKRFADPEPLRE
jgi:uncharacterized circularly permuted ATP-grasp superfamily protein